MEFNFFYLHLISIPSIAFVIAVIIKGFSSIFTCGKFNIKKALSSGGMPSVHSAVVTSLTTAVALKYGVSSDLFAISLGFTVIIIYDAINIRYEAGLHAVAINKLLGEKFKESLGHLPSEAFAGSVLGILVSMFLFYI
ncbi:MAG: divergent PAP2 family protein [Candidatus Gracilibacteria bacterium]|nr:divergent PAP2 family protein [Candidatus Gracilibacteria bacterium]